MKIYNNKRRYLYDLERFVGKEVWVKVDYDIYGIYWFRFVSEQQATWTVNRINDLLLNSDFTGKVAEDYLNEEVVVWKGSIAESQPIELMSTEELYAILGIED